MEEDRRNWGKKRKGRKRERLTTGTGKKNISAKVFVSMRDTAWGTKSYMTITPRPTDYPISSKVSTPSLCLTLAAPTTSGLWGHLQISSQHIIQKQYQAPLTHDLMVFGPVQITPTKLRHIFKQRRIENGHLASRAFEWGAWSSIYM